MKSISVFFDINDINPDVWDEFTKGESVYYSRKWLLSNQYALSSEVKYIVLMENNKIFASAIISIVRNKIEWDYYNTHLIAEKFNFPESDYLLVGVPFGYCDGLLWESEMDLKLLHSGITNEALLNNISDIAIIHSDRNVDYLLKIANYSKIKSCDDTLLSMAEFSYNYDNYIQSIGRKRYKKEVIPFVNSQFSVVRLEDFSSVSNELAILDEEIVGFSLFIVFENIAYFKTCGFNYDLIPKEIYAYFNLSYYIPIKDFIQLKEIHHGVGTLDAKKQRGSIITEKYLLIRKVNES